jgi:RNA-binding motif protein, X-linked 2
MTGGCLGLAAPAAKILSLSDLLCGAMFITSFAVWVSAGERRMNVIKEIERINRKELDYGIYGGNNKGSWHDQYKNSAWVYVGGLSYELSEGDILCVMSQWGEVEDINLIREKGTNKSKGFVFLKYEDQRSTILAVDNFNGIKLLGRVLRVDHVDQYKLPKEIREREEERLEENPEADVNIGPGHAYSSKELANEFSIAQGQNLWSQQIVERRAGEAVEEERKKKKSQKEKKKKKKSKKVSKSAGGRSDSDSRSDSSDERKKSRKRKHSKNEEEEVDFMRGVLPLPSQSHDAQFLPVMESVTDMTPVTVDPSGTLLAPGDVSASWRGRMDPERMKAIQDHKERMEKAEKLGPQSKRDEFEGFGGMNRRR